jgi:hypothetical protein
MEIWPCLETSDKELMPAMNEDSLGKDKKEKLNASMGNPCMKLFSLVT